MHDALLRDRRPRRARARPGRRAAAPRSSTSTGSWATSWWGRCASTRRRWRGRASRCSCWRRGWATWASSSARRSSRTPIQDVDAAVRWLRAQGFDTIVLSGYSSGATLATRYAAIHHVPDLRALVCLGNPWGLPQSMRERADRFGAHPPYDELVRTVERGDRRRSRRARARPAVPGGAQPRSLQRAPRQRGLHLPHLVALAGARRRAGHGPSARSARCGRRSCWCRAPTTRWCTPRRPRAGRGRPRGGQPRRDRGADRRARATRSRAARSRPWTRSCPGSAGGPEVARISHRGGRRPASRLRRRRPRHGRRPGRDSETEDGQSWDGMIFLPREGMDRRRRLAVLVRSRVGRQLPLRRPAAAGLRARRAPASR